MPLQWFCRKSWHVQRGPVILVRFVKMFVQQNLVALTFANFVT